MFGSLQDNVVRKFCLLAAKNGMDVFRIFDCFNQVDCMQVCIDAVREAGKVAEVAICYTSDFTTSDIYTLDYYKDLAQRIEKAGAHVIALKDMAGLLKPQHAKPLMEAIKSVTTLPIHYHGHNTSSANLATIIALAAAGVDVVDGCMASMADTTSQPSMNAFLASVQGTPYDTQVGILHREDSLTAAAGILHRVDSLTAAAGILHRVDSLTAAVRHADSVFRSGEPRPLLGADPRDVRAARVRHALRNCPVRF